MLCAVLTELCFSVRAAPVQVKIITLRQYGGEQAPASVLAPKVGPMGMSPKKVGDGLSGRASVFQRSGIGAGGI